MSVLKLNYPSIVILFLSYFANCFTDETIKYKFPTPNSDEVLLLEYTNYLRQNPNVDSFVKLLTSHKVLESNDIKLIDRKMLIDELKEYKKTTPVFFDPDLMIASKLHSNYMVKNGQSHIEDKNNVYFNGVKFSDRLKNIGFEYNGIGENCFLNGESVEHSILAFLIDWGEGLGNMQPERRHRKCLLNSNAKLIGNGIVKHGDKISVTQIFSSGNLSSDYIGGVIYTDKNGNNFYDIGEGHGGVNIIINNGLYKAVSWTTGLYVIEIPKCKSFNIEFSYSKVSKSLNIEKEIGNYKVDWIMTLKEESQILNNQIEKFKLSKNPKLDLQWDNMRFAYSSELFSKHVDISINKKLNDVYESIMLELCEAKPKTLNNKIIEAKNIFEDSIGIEWLKAVSYLSEKKSLLYNLKGTNGTKEDWKKFDIEIETTKFPYNEINYFLKKIKQEVELTIKDK